MFHNKVSTSFNEKEALKREIDYLSKLINNHVTRPPIRLGNRGSRRTCSGGVSKLGQSHNVRREVHFAARPKNVSKTSNPYKYESRSIGKEREKTLMSSKYKLVKKTVPIRNEPTPKRLKTVVDRRIRRASSSSSSSKRRKVVRTQYKVVNGTPSKGVGKKYILSSCARKIFLHRPTRCLSSSGGHRSLKWWQTKWTASNKRSFGCRRYLFDPLDIVAKRKHGGNAKQTTQLTSINGMLYRVSRNKLSREVRKLQCNKRTDGRIISVFGVKYRMDPAGKTLTRIPNGSGVEVATEGSLQLARIDLGRMTYKQTSPGLWTKMAATDARNFVSRAVHRSIVTANQRKRLTKDNRYCTFYNRFGKCLRKERCPFVHDPEKIAVCTRFLRGTCKRSDCPFSHVVAPSKMPVCSYFLRGRCSSENCPYRHVKVATRAGVCKHFLGGFCPAGDRCKKLHTLDCPDFVLGKGCEKRSKCPLRHPESKKKNVKESNVVDRRTGNEEGHELPSFISIASDREEEEQDGSGRDDLQMYPRFLLSR